jgi:hypothetical protein
MTKMRQFRLSEFRPSFTNSDAFASGIFMPRRVAGCVKDVQN